MAAVTQIGMGTSDWKIIDTDVVSPTNVGIAVVVTGSVTYTVEHTYDDVLTVDAPTVFSHPTLVDKIAAAEGSYVTPIAFIRINVTVGTGTAVMTFLQAGVPG